MKTRTLSLVTVLSGVIVVASSIASADETCMSPFMPKITGQEDYVYAWTLGIDGVGDGSDKLVTVSVNPKSPNYGKVIHSVSVGGQHEAHHAGFTDDRRYLWAGGLDDSMIYVFDLVPDPSKPKLVKTIDSFVKDTGGVVGPHGFYALPGRLLIAALSNDKDKGGKTAIVEYTNDGKFIRTTWLPDDAEYGYDARIQPRLNRMLSSAFTGHNNYMRDLGELMGDAEAMKNFGSKMVVWDFHAYKPLQTLDVPGAPLEIRWALQPHNDWAFVNAPLTSKIWLVYQKDDGTFAAKDVITLGDGKNTLFPVDISIAANDKFLTVDTFADGMARIFDISDPHNPKLAYEEKIGSQVNMVSQSWDGERLYFTSSLLANWDKKGKDNEQFFKAYTWDGKKLTKKFEIDFIKEGLGRPHIMRLGQDQFYKNQIFAAQAKAVEMAQR
jgi:selenium-binding protein 1